MMYRQLLILVVALLGLWAYVTQPMLAPGARTPGVTVDSARLRQTVETVSGQYFPRDAGHPANLGYIALHIKRQLARAGGEVRLQSYPVGDRHYHNVIATFGPGTRQRVVVGAHYDAFGELPGADDNASGTAGLIELARLLGETTLSMRVELAAYTLEEPPYFLTRHMGSAVHAASLQREGADVRMMFALESIGYFNDTPDSQQFPWPFLGLVYPTTANFIAVVGRVGEARDTRTIKRAMRSAGDLPVHSMNATSAVPGLDFSDHVSFWNAGYPAVMITDTAFYRNDAYHTSGDTPDTLDYRRMAQVVAGVHAAVLEFAGAPDTRPGSGQ